MSTRRLLIVAGVALLVLTAFGVARGLGVRFFGTQVQTAPARLRVTVLPDQAPERLRATYLPLLAYLSRELGLPCDLVLHDNYEQMSDALAAGQIDLAFLGGVTFAIADARGAAVPLVMRDVDRHFTSVFLVPARERRTRLDEFRGARFTFGPRLSTSGHIMPRSVLDRQGIAAETFFSEVSYSTGHDQTAARVRDGLVDLGAANAVVVERMFASGELPRDAVRVLVETPPFADYVWAARPGVPDALRGRVRDAFLALSEADPSEAAILALQGAHGYLPASRDDFQEVMDTWRRIGGTAANGAARQ